jgi:arylsulfatase A-like enzyme
LQQGFDTYEELYRLESPEDDGAAAATDAASRWIREATSRGKPFFAFVNYFEAHLPYEPHPGVLDRVGGVVGPDKRVFTVREAEDYLVGEGSASPEDLGRARLLYKAEIAYLDAHVGHLVDLLRAEALLDGTLLIVTSDHGEHLGEHGLTGHEFSLYEEVLRVPLIVRYPARFRPGARVGAAVSLVDIAPTVLEVLGAGGAMPELQGESLVRVARSGTRRGREILAGYARPASLIHDYWREAHPDADLSRYDVGLRAVLRDRWKYVRSSRGDEALYDLESDAREELNLAVSGTGEERERRLLELRRAYQRSFGD